jgi:hypothetical protein
MYKSFGIIALSAVLTLPSSVAAQSHTAHGEAKDIVKTAVAAGSGRDAEGEGAVHGFCADR